MSMVVIVAIALVVILAVWYSLSNQANSTPENQAGIVAPQRITPQEYQTRYSKNDHRLVDVRSAEEFSTGYIAGATNIALPDLPQQMATLPKEQPIVLYCRSGARSSSAAQLLAQAGYTNVYDLGGITQWREQGLPTQS